MRTATTGSCTKRPAEGVRIVTLRGLRRAGTSERNKNKAVSKCSDGQRVLNCRECLAGQEACPDGLNDSSTTGPKQEIQEEQILVNHRSSKLEI